MRRIVRLPLPDATRQALDDRQQDANQHVDEGSLDIEAAWKAARASLALRVVVAVLHTMAGERQRCMYCSDSHGSDIDHFWPKGEYPAKLFEWNNLVLCCTECGRFKGNRFPLANGVALLLDPTAEDPWLDLDFDPMTGNLVASFDLTTGAWSPRGGVTVEVLRLDRREALAASYKRTYRRLVAVVQAALEDEPPNAQLLFAALQEADDHGLLGWCFRGTGQNTEPFTHLRTLHAEVWQYCVGQIV